MGTTKLRIVLQAAAVAKPGAAGEKILLSN